MKPQFVEFDRDTMRPFAAYADGHYYDIDYCRRDDQFYIDMSGGSLYLEWPDNLWWAECGVYPTINGTDKLAPIGNRIELPGEYLDEEGQPLDVEMWASHDRCIACEVCQDNIPTDDLCDCLEWSDNKGDYVQKEAE